MKTVISFYLVLAVILAQFFAAYFFSKGRTAYWRAFSVLVFCISIYLFGYLMIINSSTLDEMIIWNKIQYLVLPFVSVLWLLVALLYTRTVYTLTPPMAFLLFFIPAITVLMRLTNPLHHLFYIRMEIRQFFGLNSLYMENGIWYYVNISYTILCMVLTVIIYLVGYLKNKVGYSKPHFFVFLFASLLPFIGIMLILLANDDWSFDYSALVIPVSLLVISYGILKFDFLEIRTLARETIFENNFAGMIVLGPGMRIIDYNKAAEEFFKTINISLDKHPIEHLFERDSNLLEIFSSEEPRDFSLVIDGEERFFEINTYPLGEQQDENTRLLKSIRDVTEERKVREQLKLLATTDSLCGLYNRAEFMNLAKKEFARAIRNNEELSLLIMDMDNFKKINDTFGHAAGDEVIREIGRIITASFRKTDIAGRIGGEEFAVVLRGASLEEAIKVAEKFRETVAEKKVNYCGQEISFTVSIGAAAIRSSNGDINDIDLILKMADDALYKAKANGRNCVVA